MANDDFTREYAAEFFRIDPRYSRAFALWCWYYLETEDYDRGLPHVMSPHGSALVRTDLRSFSTKFAAYVYETVKRSIRDEGLVDYEEKAKAHASQYAGRLDVLRSFAEAPRPA